MTVPPVEPGSISLPSAEEIGAGVMTEPSAAGLAAEPPSARTLLSRRRVRLGQRSIRQFAARGTIINSGFSVSMALVALARGFLLARFLTAEDYGVWGIIIGSLGSLLWLKQIGIGDKYIQQDEGDEELGFQRAFTLECLVSAFFTVVVVVAAPVVTLIYGRPELLLPGLALALIIPAGALQAPSWIFYRQMRFVEQRLLQSIDPVVGTITALALAIAGAGYWALLAGVAAGAWSAALATVLVCPYRLRLRFDRRVMRSYLSFSWPLFVATAAGVVIVQASLFFGTVAVSLAAAGAITLSANVSQFAQQVDQIVTGTMYPLVCAVQERLDLLHESFVKSNRLALIWAVPFGVGLTLFAPDLVRYGLGERWHIAIPLLRAFGLTEAIGHLAFNWDAYFRARGETKPMAWAAFITMVSFLVTAIPLVFIWGLPGFAVGVAIQMLVNVACRVYYLTRLFDGFDMLRHAARACAPTVPAVAVVLLARLVEGPGRGPALVAVELFLYLAVTVVATWALERSLLRELVGYLRRAAAVGAADDSAPVGVASATAVASPSSSR